MMSPSERTHYFPSVTNTTKQQFAPESLHLDAQKIKKPKHDKMYHSKDFGHTIRPDPSHHDILHKYHSAYDTEKFQGRRSQFNQTAVMQPIEISSLAQSGTYTTKANKVNNSIEMANYCSKVQLKLPLTLDRKQMEKIYSNNIVRR